MRKKPFVYIIFTLMCIGWFAYVTTQYGSTEDTAVLVRAGALPGHSLSLQESWRLLSAMFVHIGFSHLLVNMSLLISMGMVIEHQIGHIKFALLYISSGISGTLTSSIIEPNVVSAGASTALFGLMGFVTAQLFNSSNRQLQHVGKSYLMLVAVNIFYTFSNSNISITGHLGGFALGFVLGLAQVIADRN